MSYFRRNYLIAMFGTNARMYFTGHVYKIVSSVILVLTCLQSNFAVAQSTCTTASGREGNCIAINQCPMVQEMVINLENVADKNTRINQIKFLRKLQCGDYDNKMPRICCPKEHRNLRLVTNIDCGDSDTPRIGKGEVAMPFEFPWMALIAYEKGNRIVYECGGSLINSRYVLTAAHCIRTRYQIIGVRLGEHDIKRQFDCYKGTKTCPRVQDIPIEEVVAHESYSDNDNDIGLIRLARDADLSYINVSPICLPVTPILGLVSLIGTRPMIAGWGTTEIVKSFSSVLRKAKLTVIDNARCQDLFSTSSIRAEHISESVNTRFCAYGPNGEDSCSGDSGGPLMHLQEYNNKERYIIYGIVSYGSASCSVGLPSVFTTVDAYMDWILDNLRP